MEIISLIFATIVGTTFMTCFSYLMSEAFGKLFKEPVLLNYIIRHSAYRPGNSQTKWAASLIHYLIGFMFAVSYYLLWTHTSIPFGWISGIIFGAISGIIGILGWVVIFRIPSKKPRVAFTAYYMQLFYAHIIFAIGVTAVFMIQFP